MSKHPRPSRRLRAGIAVAALGLFAALPAPALAAPGTGSVELTLKPGGAKSLLGQDVQVRYSAKTGKTGSAKRVAASKAKRVSLLIAEIVLGLAPYATTEGGLTLSLDGHKATVQPLTIEAAAGGAAVLGKVGKKQLTLFRVKGDLQFDSSSLKLENGKLSLTGPGANALRQKLGLEQLASGALGSLSIDAALISVPQAALTPAPAQPETKKPRDEGPDLPVDPFAANCDVGAGDDLGFGDPPTDPGPLETEPTLSNPLALTAGETDFGFASSFRNYVLGTQEPGSTGSILGLGGALDNGDGSFAFSGTGEYQRQRSAGDDQLVLDGKGTMLFCKAAHNFHVALADPTVVLDGDDSRLVVDAGLNDNGLWGGFRRADFASLDLDGLRPTYSADGKTATWANVPAKLTAEAAAVTGLGQYPAGTALPPITVSAAVDTVPDLYADTCAINSTATEAALELPEAPSALPSLPGADPIEGGGLRWGIHTPLRNNTLAPNPTAGTLQTFEGASYDAGNSVFDYPAGGGLYDEGVETDPADDKLVLNADGIALLCKPAHLHRYALGNPTVVIDGANSRLVVDMDLRVKSLIGPSVRGDFATLNVTGIVPTVDSGTITWANIPATLTQNGSEAFNGRYPAGTLIDPITVSAELP